MYWFQPLLLIIEQELIEENQEMDEIEIKEFQGIEKRKSVIIKKKSIMNKD
jgi:hypothetical protein